MNVSFELNGGNVAVETRPNRTLLDLLREELGVTSVKKGCQLFSFRRYSGRAKNECIRTHLHWAVQHLVRKGNLESVTVPACLRWLVSAVAKKQDTLASCLLVIVFQQTVHPHIPKEDNDLHIRIQFLEFKRVFDRSLATDTAAVGIILIAGAHTLDHHHPLPSGRVIGVLMEELT